MDSSGDGLCLESLKARFALTDALSEVAVEFAWIGSQGASSGRLSEDGAIIALNMKTISRKKPSSG